MKRFHTLLILIPTVLTMMATTSFGQENDKKTLILQLPETHRWTTDLYDDGELWAVRYNGYLGDGQYPDIEIEQTNMLHEHMEMPPQQIAKQITMLIENYDDTAKLTLRKEQEVDGDDCLFYTITTATSTILLFYRQSETLMHSIELELHDDQLARNDIHVWESVFFGSVVSAKNKPEYKYPEVIAK